MDKKGAKYFQKRLMGLSARKRLIIEGEKVVVAVSGGKDSMVLLHALAESRRFVPIHYELHAVHVHPIDIPLQQDREGIRNFCHHLQVPYSELPIVTEQVPEKVWKGACFRCSWARRKALFALMNEVKGDKLAFGHHLDDAVETLLMNMISHGEISAFPYSMQMRKSSFSIIRPLLGMKEQEVIAYAHLAAIKTFDGSCPHEQHNKRTYFRDLLQQLETNQPAARQNLFTSMSKIFPEHLPK